jgi:D-arabinose 1-dehydrogenase-like Zn-dependent alcohol dehydrogenase
MLFNLRRLSVRRSWPFPILQIKRFVDLASQSCVTTDVFQRDAKELGADEFVETREGFAESMQDKLDLIIVRIAFIQWPTSPDCEWSALPMSLEGFLFKPFYLP